jgi:hypothetical protein
MNINIFSHKGITNLKYNFDFTANNVYLIYGPNGIGKTSFLNYFEEQKSNSLKVDCFQSFKNKNLSFGINLFDNTNKEIKLIIDKRLSLINELKLFNEIFNGNKKYNISYKTLLENYKKVDNDFDFFEEYNIDFLINLYKLFFFNENVTNKDIFSWISLVTDYRDIQKKYDVKLTKTERNELAPQEKSLKKIGFKLKEQKDFNINEESFNADVDKLFKDRKNFIKSKREFFEKNIEFFPIDKSSYEKIENSLIYYIVHKNLKTIENICSLTDEYNIFINNQKNIFDKWNKTNKEYESIFVTSPVKFSLEKDNNDIYYVEFNFEDNRHSKSDAKNLKPLFESLSTSEQRSIYLLDIMHRINCLDGTENILIFDDIVDTFDEVNQSSISYFIDLLEKKGYKFIILTHNYNFFKCLNFKLFKNKNLILQRNNEGSALVDFKGSTDYIFKSWFTDNKLIYKPDYLIALSSVLRELNNIDKKYPKNELLKFIHIKKETKSLTFIDYIDEIKSFFISSAEDFITTNYKDSYLNVVFKTCDDICKTTNVSDNLSDSIVEKICLSIGIRLSLELCMIDYLDFDCLDSIDNNQTKTLINKIRESDLTKNNKFITAELTKFDIASSNIIHLNSFNYEVLFYYNTDYLKKLYKEIKNKSLKN